MAAGEQPSQASLAEDERSGRVLLALLAGAGATETGVLAADKLWNLGAADAVCLPGGGCADVLSGPWSSISGVPLSLIGFVAYTSVAALAVAPVLQRSDGASATADSPVAGLVVFGASGLASFSACLMLLLAFVIREPCVLCITSAALSAATFAVAWRTPLVRSRTDAAMYAATGALVSLTAAATLFFAQQPLTDKLPDTTMGVAAGVDAATMAKPRPPTIRNRSSPRALEIAKQLQARGGRFYGAYWCSHCANQKETLGKEAMALVPYLECDANGADTKRDQCQAAGIRGYPTWQIDGQLYAGERDLDELEALLKGEVQAD